ncbi:MAG: rod shape-determining protein MreC [Elusimicrobia bacterium]|nr:rod shape-determining protein MreC [Elusimicrobiota bacterium]
MFQRHRTAVLFGLYTLLSLGLLAGSADRVVQSLKHTFYYLWSPVATVVVGQMDQWGVVGSRLAALIRADQRARHFESRWIQERLDAKRLMTLEDENRRLADLLGFTPRPRFRATAARVWARDPADWFHTLLVEPGAPGVAEGDAVITVQDGRAVVVGQVRELLPDGKARVLLLTDSFSALSAHVVRTGEQGLVEGRGTGRLFLNYLFSDSTIQPGDEVATSGLGEVYPANISVGWVSDVLDAAGASSKRAAVIPFARLGYVREVLILTRTAGPAAVENPVP